MIDIARTVDLVSSGAELLRNHAPQGVLPSPAITAGLVLAIGIVLTLKGAKLLRFLFIGAFLFAGGAAGMKAADSYQVDLLIGLGLGAGIAAIVAHLMFRWWVAISAGLVALLLVGWLAGQRQWPAALEEFANQRQTLTAEDFNNALAGSEDTGPAAAVTPYAREAWEWLWTNRQNLVVKSIVVCGLAFLVGVGLGLLAPRFTVVVGTSIVGVAMVFIGIGALISIHHPSWWDTIEQHPIAFWSLAGIILLFSVMTQATRPKTVPASPAADDSESA